MERLQSLLDTLPANLEPLDVVMVDGYLCGVLLQPRPVPVSAWLPLVIDADGQAPPPGFALEALRELLFARHTALNQAIHLRQWFDPWVYTLDEDASPSETVMPWVAGFAMAVDQFGLLMARHEDQLLEPLAILYRHLDPDDLEDADELLAEIDTYEPPATIAEAVEDLVRGVLLIADASRPMTRASPSAKPASVARRGPPRRPGPPRR